MPSNRLARLAVPIIVVLVVVMMVVPLPAAVLDLLIASNIAMSLVVLLVAMQVRKPLDFAVFPTMVLVGTILRLALNVSSTRLVLRDGYAGNVIDAFGHIVIGGSLVIGLVVFAILVIIQLTVVTNGAARVAEVGARFTLDAMPGKQMAIDADLNSGLIDEDEARRRRKEVAAEADFYGAMDGGTKFVKGDAIAAVIITLVNLIGGFAVGMLQRGMSPGEAISTYSLLTVGDGLVSQIPALLMSVATGVIVTRSTSDGRRRQRPRRTALPAPGGAADRRRRPARRCASSRECRSCRSSSQAAAAARLDPFRTPPAERDAGPAARARPGALPAAPRQPDAPESDPVTESLRSTRSSCSSPPTSSTSSTRRVAATCSTGSGRCAARPRSTWASCCRRCAPGTARRSPPAATRSGSAGSPRRPARRPPGTSSRSGTPPTSLPGRRTTEPVFGLPAVWVAAGAPGHRRDRRRHPRRARRRRHHAPRRDGAPARVADCCPWTTSANSSTCSRPSGRRPSRSWSRGCCRSSAVQRVLQGLLDEQVSIRDLGRVLEGVGQRARVTTDADALLEAARAALGPALTVPYLTERHAARDHPRAGCRAGVRRGHASQRTGCRPRPRPPVGDPARPRPGRPRHPLPRTTASAPVLLVAGPSATSTATATAWQPSPLP